ncbi:tRNA (adenosine(37)-N6)-threonylcarbamoyltransferase complex dimerization subunit type 1 TsaB [Anaeromyxobacter oryzae]|uniref:tRNA (Adenosine(37)-N6)-threonylcarbamoyltransferase complex dimerization subunit type 1 TsaB n=1 Tax=Anaeromyxobacter oryzae TaxID=2918170 RepID=A0ABN6MN98_9BACT|nr:tRNA (adenosine(37)-N6)-threonylcarbamoyltransferase complex dimerization subunit type 1 TsaB [Anaeromyxobacter oryzae]BDG02456.1 tRNA (adenosine(37)-N6)-threonylcarbamoyltransferase complex dimerization subunit type 1 TsaB [Anaeromyxobacter oryzae]
MLVAALDTATLTLSCVLADVAPGAAARVRCERTEHAPAKAARGAVTGGHGARLPSALTDLLVAEGLTLPDVEGYAIGIGPGSFTGLRIGLATWKGLAYANRRPLAGVSSLAAMALAAAADAPEGTLLVPLLDAKKGEVYAGFYRAEGKGVAAVAPDAALGPDALVARLAALPDPGAARAFGEGYAAFAAALEGRLTRLATAVVTPPASAVAALAGDALLSRPFDAQALFALEPHYVRPSEAELKFPHGLGPGATKPA